MKFLKKVYKPVLIILAVFLLLTWWTNYKIESTTRPFITDNLANLPACKTALLLGTSKVLKHQQVNEYFYRRISAAVDLYKSGKIKYIIVSGDNSIDIYNEPADMKKDLIKNGVPDSVIYLDYAGFRTFDSVVRAKEVFGQDSVIMVSQEFHNQRAVFIAQKIGMVAYGYNAEDVDANIGFKTRFREFFARAKVFWDVYTGVKPHFLGEKIKVGK
ncbi:MAG TPA: ElyC/SanA/YdcF family protein [Bacteroidia bacterium]|jgi:SanA protein|nr:ElyC/SanA/YdcF family protein [Bacteroidia bacterium]